MIIICQLNMENIVKQWFFFAGAPIKWLNAQIEGVGHVWNMEFNKANAGLAGILACLVAIFIFNLISLVFFFFFFPFGFGLVVSVLQEKIYIVLLCKMWNKLNKEDKMKKRYENKNK